MPRVQRLELANTLQMHLFCQEYEVISLSDDTVDKKIGCAFRVGDYHIRPYLKFPRFLLGSEGAADSGTLTRLTVQYYLMDVDEHTQR